MMNFIKKGDASTVSQNIPNFCERLKRVEKDPRGLDIFDLPGKELFEQISTNYNKSSLEYSGDKNTIARKLYDDIGVESAEFIGGFVDLVRSDYAACFKVAKSSVTCGISRTIYEESVWHVDGWEKGYPAFSITIIGSGTMFAGSEYQNSSFLVNDNVTELREIINHVDKSRITTPVGAIAIWNNETIHSWPIREDAGEERISILCRGQENHEPTVLDNMLETICDYVGCQYFS